ncbi:hypothetical protein [Thermogemmatispora sp.]|uniref:hypothetical protein n=1 Tax=Thermogemmatispora sp. TaxID=1968838 RepID=UPI0035E45841
MNFSLLNKLVLAARRDGLTLQWSLIHLLERLERYEQRLSRVRYWGGGSEESEAQQLRLDSEALALVLAAVLKAYPAGADLVLEEQCQPEPASPPNKLELDQRDGQVSGRQEPS